MRDIFKILLVAPIRHWGGLTVGSENRVNIKSYEKVLEYVKNGIVSGNIKQGDKLPTERYLADMLNIGRYSVREGIRVLESLGIAECIHGGGNYISDNFEEGLARIVTMIVLLRKTDCYEIDDFRRGLEKQALFLCLDSNNLDSGNLIKIAESMRTADSEGCAELDSQFHRYIYDSAGNTLINTVLEALCEITSSIMGNVWKMTDNEERFRLINCHIKIAECLIKKDKTEIADAVNMHYDYVDKIFGKGRCKK